MKKKIAHFRNFQWNNEVTLFINHHPEYQVISITYNDNYYVVFYYSYDD